MVTDNFTVVFTGVLLTGWTSADSVKELTKTVNLSETSAKKLVKRTQTTKLKGGLSHSKAKAMAKRLLACGLKVDVVSPKINTNANITSNTVDDLNIQAVFAGHCPTVRTSLLYSVRLFSTVILTLILPLIYFFILVMVAYLSYLYIDAVINSGWSILGASRLTTKLVEWVALPFIGLMLLIFLIKPLFSTYKERPSLLLSKSAQPEFYELVYALCDYVKAPRPNRIYVDNSVNAYASFDGGMKGLFKKKLVLGVGLPLVNGMTANQLVGVLAHEFGHFTQRGGMMAMYLINSANRWLYSRAHERDSFDEMIEGWSDDSDFSYWTITLSILLACIAVVRKLFSVLLDWSVKISSSLSREMEYDADRFEVEVSGSDNFEEAAIALRGLSVSESIAHAINYDSFDESQQIFEDVPSAINEVYRRLSPERKKTIERDMKKASTNVWSTHPADNDRVKQAKKLNKVGIFHYSFPAYELLNNIEELNKKISIYDYSNSDIRDPKRALTTNEVIFSNIKASI